MFQLINNIIIHNIYSTENFFVRIYYAIEEIYYVIVISFFLYITLILLVFLKLCQWFMIAQETFFCVSICMKQICGS